MQSLITNCQVSRVSLTPGSACYVLPIVKPSSSLNWHHVFAPLPAVISPSGYIELTHSPSTVKRALALCFLIYNLAHADHLTDLPLLSKIEELPVLRRFIHKVEFSHSLPFEGFDMEKLEAELKLVWFEVLAALSSQRLYRHVTTEDGTRERQMLNVSIVSASSMEQVARVGEFQLTPQLGPSPFQAICTQIIGNACAYLVANNQSTSRGVFPVKRAQPALELGPEEYLAHCAQSEFDSSVFSCLSDDLILTPEWSRLIHGAVVSSPLRLQEFCAPIVKFKLFQLGMQSLGLPLTPSRFSSLQQSLFMEQFLSSLENKN